MCMANNDRKSPDIEYSEQGEAYARSLDLVNRERFMILGMHGTDYPLMRAVTKMGNDELRLLWFCTKESSHKVAALRADARASVYFIDPKALEGLMLYGRVEIVTGTHVGYAGPGPDTETGALNRLANRGLTAGCALHPGYVVGVFHVEGGNYTRRGSIADLQLGNPEEDRTRNQPEAAT
jgi:hypothetical protein